MKSLIVLSLISLALLQSMKADLDQVGGNSLYTDGLFSNEECAGMGCNRCFIYDTVMTCYDCKEDYIRSPSKGCWQYKPREISGYGRDCIVCLEGNYPFQGKCFPCPYKCKACHYESTANGPICDTCKPDTAQTPGYNFDDDCSCKYGLSVDENEFVKACFCNDENMFTYANENGGVGCYKCGLCFRNFPNCKDKGTCPTKTYDPLTCENCKKVNIEDISSSAIDSSICCKDCDITCETCSGPGRENCITCRNEGEQIFEWVETEQQCMCVCHSKEVVENGVVKCVCNEGREAKLVADKDDVNKQSYQCVCKEGTTDAEKPNKDGIVECI